MHNVRLAASRVGHNGWSKYDEQYRLKKERNPSVSWGVVDYELWIMFVNTPSGPAQSSSVTSYQGNSSGVNSSFRSNSGAKTSSREAWSGTERLSSLPTKQSAAALPSTGAPALSTLVSLDTDVQPVEGPTHNQTAPQGAIRLCPSLYSLAKTPIVYDQLSFEL